MQERRRDRERDACAHWVGEEVSRRGGGGVECGERGTNSEEMTKIFTNETRLKPSNCRRMTTYTRAHTHTHVRIHTHKIKHTLTQTLSLFLALVLSLLPHPTHPLSPSDNVQVFQTHQSPSSFYIPPILSLTPPTF